MASVSQTRAAQARRNQSRHGPPKVGGRSNKTMGGSNVFTDIVVYSMLVAGIFVMTSNANGTNLIKAGTSGYAGIVQAATGQTVSA